jgi:hypothetical protein
MKTFMTIAVMIAVIFGVGFLIIPDWTIKLYGVTLNDSGRFVARYLGSALLGMGMTWWDARYATSRSELVRGGLFGALIFSFTGLIVAVWDALAGPSNNFVWVNALIYAFLAVGFGIFFFKQLKQK